MYINPEQIIVDFLRVKLTDPRGRGESNGSYNVDAVSGQLIYPLTAPSGSVQCVTRVVVDGDDLVKWKDYYVDMRNQSIILLNEPNPGDAIETRFKYGTKSWIFDSKKKISKSTGTTGGLKFDDYPRIIVKSAAGTDERLGRFNCEVESTMLFQIDCWAKEKQNSQVFTIDGNMYAGDALAKYFIWKAKQAFEDYEGDLHPVLYDYKCMNLPKELPFDGATQSFHFNIDIILKGLSMGRL